MSLPTQIDEKKTLGILHTGQSEISHAFLVRTGFTKDFERFEHLAPKTQATAPG